MPEAALSISPFERSRWRLRRVRDAMGKAARFRLVFGWAERRNSLTELSNTVGALRIPTTPAAEPVRMAQSRLRTRLAQVSAVSLFVRKIKCDAKLGEGILVGARVPRLRAWALCFPGSLGTLYGQVAMNDRTKASRRKLITFAAALASARSWIMKAQTPLKPDSRPVNADQALRELLAGNHRFLTGNRISPRGRQEEFRALMHGQFPEAVIICCADSRVAPEILFDVGVGDIFVVRVAGNVIDGAGVTVKGRIEYAVAELNVPLILILGHSGCGAVKSAIKHIDNRDSQPGAISESRLCHRR
jgi:hypothetical protein